MPLPEYPKSVDPEIWAVVLDAVHGTFPNPRHAVHCLYEVEGYALGMFYAEQLMAADASTALEPEKFIEAMATGKKMAGKVDWLALLKLILSIIGPLILKPTP